jgi:hypothetical protein
MAALLAAGCVPEHGPLMEPGADCLRCHDGDRAKRWTAAGTWGGQGNTVAIQDAGGKAFTLTTNQVGNFYTAEPLTFPLQVAVNGTSMPGGLSAQQGGSCNRCHLGGETPGPLMSPGRDCLGCHDGAGAKLWTVAGTWSAPGATVTVSDARGATATMTTNEVGNFYTETSLTFPLTARVGGQTMPGAVTYGGCNSCHGRGGVSN